MAFVYQGDTELESKSKKAAERISENMHIVANEPSLALYRLQEHVRKALPPMVERRVEVTKLQHELQGRCYDVEYALSQRASKFTEDEIMLFQKLLKKYRGTILCKKSGKVNPKEREMAWEKLTEEFNASTGVTKQRSIVQMKNKWDYMKRLAKKEAAAFKKATQEAREGSPPPPLDESTIFLIDTMRASMAGFENDSCDALDEVSEKPKSIEDNTVESEIAEDMQSCGSKNGSTNLNVIDYSRLNDLEIKVKVEQECPDSPEAHQNILPHSLKLRRLQFNETTARNTRARYMEMTERKKKYWLPVNAVKSMDGAATSFMNIQEMLKQSIFLKQQLKYEEARRNKKDSNSVYKRLSAHIVLDLPDLSEFSMVRETTNRIENMMAHARGSSAELHRSHTTLH